MPPADPFEVQWADEWYFLNHHTAADEQYINEHEDDSEEREDDYPWLF